MILYQNPLFTPENPGEQQPLHPILSVDNEMLRILNITVRINSHRTLVIITLHNSCMQCCGYMDSLPDLLLKKLQTQILISMYTANMSWTGLTSL